jgi:hypothetical protein
VPLGKVTDRVMAFIDENEKAEEYSAIQAWRFTNSASLKEFWGYNKNEALEIKRRLEAVAAKMSAEP